MSKVTLITDNTNQDPRSILLPLLMPSPSPPSCEKASASTEDDNKSRTELNKECQRCLSYLTNALKQPGKTQSLLKALGAVRPPSSAVSRNAADTTVNGNATTSSSQMYQLTSDRRGVVLHLDSRHAIHSPVMDATDRIQPRISLQKRLTNAASRMVYGATGAESNASGESGAVLTTSPKQGEIMHKQEMPKETTITIECMECGSETRAEAGGESLATFLRIYQLFFFFIIAINNLSSILHLLHNKHPNQINTHNTIINHAQSTSLCPRSNPPLHNTLLQPPFHPLRNHRSTNSRTYTRVRCLHPQYGFTTVSLLGIFGGTCGERG